MRLRRRLIGGVAVSEMKLGPGWKRLSGVPKVDALVADRPPNEPDDLLSYLQLQADVLLQLGPELPDADPQDGMPLLPVVPRSFRDFMLYEAHVIGASRGMVRRLMPGIFPMTRAFEKLTGRPFPKFKPHKLWYRQPIYYFGNHVNMLTEGAEIPWPAYTDLLDYELEIGAVLARPLRNATPDEAAKAIGGFVVLNDFSARDVQIDEMQSGFGPQKSKHFANAISAEIVSADEVLADLDRLTGSVAINGEQVALVSSAGGQFTLPEAISFASKSESLVPGELFGSGTLPGGAGIENDALVVPGDQLTLTIDGIGSLTNTVAIKETQNADRGPVQNGAG